MAKYRVEGKVLNTNVEKCVSQDTENVSPAEELLPHSNGL